MNERILIQKKLYDLDYIDELISDMLDAEGKEDNDDNRLDALNMLHNTTYLPDIDASQES